MAKLEPNVIAKRSLLRQDLVPRETVSGFDGFVKQGDLWGVYPGEVVE